MVSKATDDDFLFLAEDETISEVETQSSGEWHLLIVDDDDAFLAFAELPNNVRADVTGAAGNEYGCLIHNGFLFGVSGRTL